MPYTDLITRLDADGLIPEEVSKQIFQDLPRASLALSKMPSVRMSRKAHRMPVLSALPMAYFRQGEGGLAQTTKIAWQNKFLTAEELPVMVPIPKAVLSDADFDIWNECRPRIVEAVGQALDAAVLFGNGKPGSWPNAIEDGAAAAGNTFVRGSVGGKDLAWDISQTMRLVEGDGYMVSGFAGAPTFKGDLRDMRDTTGALLFQPSLQAGTPGTLYNESIEFVENGSWDGTRADVICGNWRQAIIGIREDVSMEVFREAPLQDPTGAIIFNLAQQGMIALSMTFRVAYQIANPVNRLNQNEATRYPFGVLRPVGFA